MYNILICDDDRDIAAALNISSTFSCVNLEYSN